MRLPLLISFFLLSFQLSLVAQPSKDYRTAVRQWHELRLEKLKAPMGWLSLAGLYWLKEGENTMGSAPDNSIRLPMEAPARMGVITFTPDSLMLNTAGIAYRHEGQLLPTVSPIQPGAIYEAGRYLWTIIRRGPMTGLRLWDRAHPALVATDTIAYYPIHKRWNKKARYQPFDTVQTVMVPNVLGMQVEQRCPGRFTFRESGKKVQLLVFEETEVQWLLVFSDNTSGVETYGGGRYLAVPSLRGARTSRLDFNKAYNPPCAFTPYATCLLPLPENRLRVSIKAGELDYGHH
jgi:uncharacterized protein (DUF1684 family)